MGHAATNGILTNNYINGLNSFNELKTVTKSPIIELQSTFGISGLRDKTNTTNSASITNNAGEYTLSTGTTTNSTATLDTRARGRYNPGIIGEGGIRIQTDSTIDGNKVLERGYLDDNNGFLFGKDSGGLYVARLKGGVEKDKTYQSNRSINTLETQTNINGYTIEPLDLQKGYVFNIEFLWYGNGDTKFSVQGITTKGGTVKVPLHYMTPTGELSINQPNLPVRAKITNNGDAEDVSVNVSGRQFSVWGEYNPNKRVTSEIAENVTVSSTIIPLVSFQRDSSDSPTSVRIDGVSLITDRDLVLEVRLDGSLTGASFGTPTNHTDSETILQSDTSATAISGGEVIYKSIVASGKGNASGAIQISDVDIDLPDEGNFTIAARKKSGENDANVSCVMRMAEDR